MNGLEFRKERPVRNLETIMTSAASTNEQPEKFSLPWDLTDWLDKPRLLSGILEEIDSLDWTNQGLVEFLRANPAFRPRFLLLLVTYAYVMGVCESEEVAELCYQDEELKRRFPGLVPSATAITRFRRENRGLLKWSVAQTFKRALREHFQLGDTTLPAGLRRIMTDAAQMRIDVGRHLDRSVQAE